MKIPNWPRLPILRQEQWLSRHEREYTFCGGVGAGKTEALFMSALQHSDIPGSRSVIYFATSAARSFWLDQLESLWDGGVGFRYYSDGDWMLPHGAILSLKVLPRYATKSDLWDFMGFDSIDTYTQSQLRVSRQLSTAVSPRGFIRATYHADWSTNDVENPYIDS